MKKQLSKQQLNDKQLKKEKFKAVSKKVLNTISYILSILFIFGLIAFIIGACNGKKQQVDYVSANESVEVYEKRDVLNQKVNVSNVQFYDYSSTQEKIFKNLFKNGKSNYYGKSQLDYSRLIQYLPHIYSKAYFESINIYQDYNYTDDNFYWDYESDFIIHYDLPSYISINDITFARLYNLDSWDSVVGTYKGFRIHNDSQYFTIYSDYSYTTSGAYTYVSGAILFQYDKLEDLIIKDVSSNYILQLCPQYDSYLKWQFYMPQLLLNGEDFHSVSSTFYSNRLELLSNVYNFGGGSNIKDTLRLTIYDLLPIKYKRFVIPYSYRWDKSGLDGRLVGTNLYSSDNSQLHKITNYSESQSYIFSDFEGNCDLISDIAVQYDNRIGNYIKYQNEISSVEVNTWTMTKAQYLSVHSGKYNNFMTCDIGTTSDGLGIVYNVDDFNLLDKSVYDLFVLCSDSLNIPCGDLYGNQSTSYNWLTLPITNYDVIANNNNVYKVYDVLTLIKYTIQVLEPLWMWQVLPYLTLGTLLGVPLVIGLIIGVFKMIKR